MQGDASLTSDYVIKVLENYCLLRGKEVKLSDTPFWDAVLISASDSSQENGYELQISAKKLRNELPISIPFHVFSDPPSHKIGCGGSTMYVLEKVFNIYGDAMYNMRFLLIPAGGYSQRLPNLTILGKLFSPLPFGENSYQMLDLILASYLPFLQHMPPGVFLASSDAIISFSLLDTDSWSFSNGGFTALAHPSPVKIGTTHGVYVLPETVRDKEGSAFMSECLRVLQKPTVDEMKTHRAIVDNFLDFGDGDKEIIFSDSAFFFDHRITKILLKFYQSNKPIKCELSSYGDFLQPLGHYASPSYIVEKTTDRHLASMRSALYWELHGAPFSVLILKNSHFHHLGTMEEYIDSLCNKNKFSEEFPTQRLSFSSFSSKHLNPSYIQGTVIHSIINPLSIVPESSVVEYCDINVAMSIGSNCIVSNVHINGFPVQRLPLHVPNDTLIHTVILTEGFATLAFNVRDDIKKSLPRQDAMQLTFFGKQLRDFIMCKSDDDIYDVFRCLKKRVSLWDAGLFRVCSSAEESLKWTLEFVLCVDECIPFNSNFTLDRRRGRWVSMLDVLLIKETERMVDYQMKLFDKIKNQKES